MSTRSYSSSRLSTAKFGEFLFSRQTPMLRAETHPGLFASLSSRFNEWRERRIALAELASLTDRELADIGVTRQEIGEIVKR